jgi:hypothetical protein
MEKSHTIPGNSDAQGAHLHTSILLAIPNLRALSLDEFTALIALRRRHRRAQWRLRCESSGKQSNDGAQNPTAGW